MFYYVKFSVDRGGSDEVTNRGWSDEVLLKP